MSSQKHTFEQSGLGRGPYQIVSPSEASSEKLADIFFCEHCGTVIKNRYFVQSSTGVHVVGVDCARKTGDQGIIDGINRMNREAKAQEREANREAVRESKLDQFKSAHGGLTPDDLMDSLGAKREAISSAWVESLNYGKYPILESLSGSSFAKSMELQIYAHQPFSAGQLSVVREIIAKKRSGARKNSAAYKQALIDLVPELDVLLNEMNRVNDEISAISQEIIDIRMS